MATQKLADDILDVIAGNSRFQEDGGTPFEAVTQTDLMEALREKGWRLPPAGHFLSEVENAGFKTRQGYQFKNKVRRVFSKGAPGRALSKYQTIIFL